MIQTANDIFVLHTAHTTYAFRKLPTGQLEHLYYGRKTDGVMDYLLTYADRGFSGNPQDAGNDRTYSLDALPQEFPCRLTSDVPFSRSVHRSAPTKRISHAKR